jgi:hypothetical protein
MKNAKRKFPSPRSVRYHTPPSTIKFQINSIYFIFFILFVRCAYIILYTHFTSSFSHVSMLVHFSLSTRRLPPHFALKLFVVITKLQQIHISTHSHILCCYYCGCVSLCSRQWKKENFTRDAKETEKDYGMCRTEERSEWESEKEPSVFTQTTNIANRSCSCLFFPFATSPSCERRKNF